MAIIIEVQLLDLLILSCVLYTILRWQRTRGQENLLLIGDNWDNWDIWILLGSQREFVTQARVRIQAKGQLHLRQHRDSGKPKPKPKPKPKVKEKQKPKQKVKSKVKAKAKLI